jgi:hypothetical protein
MSNAKIRPTALISQSYDWDADPAVREVLVFLTDRQLTECVENKDASILNLIS